jgi:ABC-2 type transport system permease protein
MSRLRTVIRHEYLTVVKQKGFWAYMISLPAIFLLVFLLIGLSAKTDNASLEKIASDLQGVAVVDASGLVSSEDITASGQKQYPVSDFEVLREDVEKGTLRGLIYYPENIVETRKYEVYISGMDFIFSNSVSEIGGALLRSSLYAPIGSQERIALAQFGAEGITTTFANGTTSVGYTRFIVPGIIAAMFLIILMFSIGYILTSISEEKENRSMEMALTYVSPHTLIIGKLVSVVLITLTQLAFFATLAIITLVIAVNTNFIQLPTNFDITALPIDPVSILFGLGFLIVGFILFAAFMALIAVLLPAKQANNFSALFYILPFVPSWFIWTVLTDPSNPVVQFITYFPITAPSTSLIRNTVGNISVGEASLSLAIMSVVAFLVLWLVIKVFPKGALEFQNPLSLRAIFSKK